MDAETEQRIKKTVRGVLEESNMDEMTEFKIRKQASAVLNLDLSKPPYKALVKRVVQSFIEEQNQKEQQQQQVEEDENQKIGDAQDQEYDDNGDHVICRLSSKWKVILQEFRGKSLVSIREFYSKDDKELPTAKVGRSPSALGQPRGPVPTQAECLDFDAIKRQKKEVQLAMHRQEVPLVNAFLHGVKMNYEDVLQAKGTGFSSRTKRAFLTSANALGEVYVTLARAKREVELARHQKEEAKATVAEAKIALQERSALQLRTDGLGRELKEAKNQLREVRAELERSKEELKLAKEELERSREEVSTVMERVNELERSGEDRAAKAVEDYKISEEFRSLILDGMVDELFTWEKRVARFNPDFEINFDTDGTPPPLPPGKEYLDGSPSRHDGGEDGGAEA